jgi:uncharacterized protein YecT (DUF1311 family)
MHQRKHALDGSCVVLACLLGAASAHAQPPAFDCAKAAGQVEKLICSDPALAARDRQLDEVFKAASKRATGTTATELRASQRGWIKGRNECWKATSTTWITASWTVDTVKDCVEAQYRLRTAELQAVWRLQPPRTVAYACQNSPANEVIANFFATDPATIRLERGDRTVTLWRVGEARLGRFEGRNVALKQEADALEIGWLNTDTGQTEELRCKAR